MPLCTHPLCRLWEGTACTLGKCFPPQDSLQCNKVCDCHLWNWRDGLHHLSEINWDFILKGERWRRPGNWRIIHRNHRISVWKNCCCGPAVNYSSSWKVVSLGLKPSTHHHSWMLPSSITPWSSVKPAHKKAYQLLKSNQTQSRRCSVVLVRV